MKSTPPLRHRRDTHARRRARRLVGYWMLAAIGAGDEHGAQIWASVFERFSVGPS